MFRELILILEIILVLILVFAIASIGYKDIFRVKQK